MERDVDGGDGGAALARQVAAHQVLVAVLAGLRALVCNSRMSSIQSKCAVYMRDCKIPCEMISVH